VFANIQHLYPKRKEPSACLTEAESASKSRPPPRHLHRIPSRCPAARVNREGAMHEYSDYLRDEAAKYRELAAKDRDLYAKREFLELANM